MIFVFLQIVLGKDGDIKAAECTCPRGKAKCHHMAALLICCHHNISVTDTPCQWSVPTEDRNSGIKTIEEMYPLPEKYEDYICTTINNTDEMKSTVYKKLSESEKQHSVGLTWLLSPEPSMQNSLPHELKTIFNSQDFLQAENKRTFLEEKAKIDEESKLFISKITLGQIMSKEWNVLRQDRLTASNFGKVLNACKRNKYPPSLFQQICGEYNLDGVKSVMWGRDNEDSAKSCFTQHMHKEIKSTGLWLHESGVLGASPDGFVDGEKAIVEIKCPYTKRNSNQSDILSDKKYIIYLNENNCCVINKTHEYYHQIQGTLYISNCNLCYLVIWTEKTSIVFPVPKDELWAKNIDILLNFYHTKLVPYITDKK